MPYCRSRYPPHPGGLSWSGPVARKPHFIGGLKCCYPRRMKLTIDDLPWAGVSRLRATGVITEQSGSTTVQFGPHEFEVAVTLLRFPQGGSWSFFVCPCGAKCRTIRLYEGELACRACLKARGLRYRIELIETPRRAAYHLGRQPDAPPRFHRAGRNLAAKQARREEALRRSLIVARQYALEEHDKVLRRL